MRPRALLALATLAVLAACGKGGTDPIVEAALKEAGQMIPGLDEDPGPAVPAQRLTRADITAANTAAIWAKLEGDPAPTLLYATALNGPYVVFFSQFRQSVIMRGSQVTGTRGLGTDLLAGWSSRNDPLATPTPPSRWPATVQRSYRFPDDSPDGRVEAFTCRFEPGTPRELVILEVRHRGIEFPETCTGPTGSFENLHFADANTGFVWRTLQWTGPEMPILDIQVIEPFTGR